MTPIEPVSVGEYLRDELAARGWTTRDCAERMGGDVDVDELTLDLHVGLVGTPDEHGLLLSLDTAVGLAHATGTQVTTWMKLDAAYHAAVARKAVKR